MLFLKYLCLVAGFGALIAAAATLFYDVYLVERYRRIFAGEGAERPAAPQPARWQLAGRLASFGALAAIAGLGIAVVPSGMAGVRVSQISGTRPGPLYPGVHFVKPMLEHVVLYDTRGNVFTTAAAPDGKIQALKAQAKEGLGIGLAVTVRYRLDAHRLDYINDNLPQPVEEELVSPVVAY